MSQRTRSHTTGDAGHKPHMASARKRDAAPPARAATTPADRASGGGGGASHHPLDPALIAQTLRAVADELERDPALARRVAISAGHATPAAVPTAATQRDDDDDAPEQARPASASRVFHPRLITGTAADLGPGIPDPFALRAQRGEAGLRAALDGLRLGTLRAIVRAHHLDPSGRLGRLNDADRLRALIVAASDTPRG